MTSSYNFHIQKTCNRSNCRDEMKSKTKKTKLEKKQNSSTIRSCKRSVSIVHIVYYLDKTATNISRQFG